METPVGLLGIPWDGSSSFLPGCSGGPGAFRDALACPSGNRFAESGHEVELRDRGDADLRDRPEASVALERIESASRRVLAEDRKLLVVGGDHFVTWPVVRAVHARHPDLSILHFDAHPDLYDALDGDRFSHACPFARILEERLCRRLVQVGIRCPTAHQSEQARRFGVEQIPMSELDVGTTLALDGPVHLSLDLDVLDPAFAPGVSHHEPGGLSVRELLGLLSRARIDLVSADIVELNPRRDLQGTTARVAAKLGRELAARMARPPSRAR